MNVLQDIHVHALHNPTSAHPVTSVLLVQVLTSSHVLPGHLVEDLVSRTSMIVRNVLRDIIVNFQVSRM